jgi:hypothetical protein
MKIQIAGSGCAKCQSAEKNVTDACAAFGIDAEISHIYDVREFGKL